MALQKEIIIIGDIEMGGGTLTDDFISDKALSELVLELSKREHPIDLVLNGDTFDFLKCPYLKNGKRTYTRHITKEVSLAKLQLIYNAHGKVFDALSKFVRSKHRNLYFTFGNHDLDLVYPEVQAEIKKILRRSHNVHFVIKYHSHGVYAEHGMQYDHLNKVDFKKLYLKHNGEDILNVSWLSFGLISEFMYIKEEHPFLERIMSRPKLFTRHRKILKKITVRAADYFLKSLIYYPWRYFTDPTYAFPKGMIKEFFTRLNKAHWDLGAIVNVFKHHKRRTLKQNKVYVLGHIHEKYLEDKHGIAIIHPGSWRDEYNLNEKGILIPVTKRYVQVIVSELGAEYQLIDFPIKRSTFRLDSVIRDEVKHIRLAAEEENYHWSR